MEKSKEVRVSTVGGQAVMEGVMMKSPEAIAMAVRRGDGTIVTEYQEYKSKAKKGSFLSWPIVRGCVTFVEALSLGMKTISRSAELAGQEIEEQPSKFELWLAEKTGKPVEKVVVGAAVVVAVLLAIGLFFVLPTLISSLVLSGAEVAAIWKSLIEGLVRLGIFLGYVAAIGCMKEVGRLFMYHGAEHKTIACYEAGLELTPENAKTCSRLHPRCGTNYMFLVMGISILFFAAVGWSSNMLIRLATRIIFLPLVAGISYEALRFGAKSDGVLARIVRAPGIALQHITTKEPDEEMLEVAITAFELALYGPKEEEAPQQEEPAKEPEEQPQQVTEEV